MTQDAAHIRLRELEEQLLLCHREYALNCLAPAVVHEFNNLMTPVLAWAQVALEKNDEASRRRALEVTVNQIQKAFSITRRLVELSRGEPVRPELCRLTTMIDNSLAALVRPLAKDGIDFEQTIEGAIRLYGEPLLVEQFFITLFVELRRLLEPNTGRIRLNASANGDGRAHIRIQVRGPALAPQRGASLMQSFLDLGAAEDGDWRRFGIGLSVARHITRLHSARFVGQLASPDGLDLALDWPIAGDIQDLLPETLPFGAAAAKSH